MTMSEEIRTFLAQRRIERTDAAQRAALGLVCGIDLEAVLTTDAPARLRALRRIRRMAGRERMRGLGGHWSYDLNRHIALQQVAVRIAESLALSPTTGDAGPQGTAAVRGAALPPETIPPLRHLGPRRRTVD